MTFWKNIKKYYLLFIVVVVLVLAGLWLMRQQNSKNVKVSEQQATKCITKVDCELNTANKYLLENNKSKALEHARKALADEPDSLDAIYVVANLVKEDNPAEAKQLYADALDVMIKQDNPDENGKKAPTYWMAAELAERAGETVLAIKYYQKVIEVANLSDGYQQSLITQSQAALKRLQ